MFVNKRKEDRAKSLQNLTSLDDVLRRQQKAHHQTDDEMESPDNLLFRL